MGDSSKALTVVIPKGCDNAPRKQIIIDFTVAVLTLETDVIHTYAAETMIWQELKDHHTWTGRDSFIASLQEEAVEKIDRLEVEQVITHGKFASINGVLSLIDGRKIDFCDVYTFSSAAKTGKVKEVKSYKIDLIQ